MGAQGGEHRKMSIERETQRSENGGSSENSCDHRERNKGREAQRDEHRE
jgi:hypothetical protein